MYSGVSGSRSAISKGSLDASCWWVQQDRTGKKSRILIPLQPIEPTLSWVKNAFWSLHLKRRQTCYLLFNAKGDIFCGFLRPRFFSPSDPLPIVPRVLSFFPLPSLPMTQRGVENWDDRKIWFESQYSECDTWEILASKSWLTVHPFTPRFSQKKTSLFQDTITLSLFLCFLRIEDWALKSETCRAINYLATRAGNQSYLIFSWSVLKGNAMRRKFSDPTYL